MISFSEEIAIENGVDEAILIHHFQYWILKNKNNKVNFIEGRTWTYQSIASIQKKYLFWGKDKLAKTISKLVKNGILLKGTFNKNNNDRTCWYAFNDETKYLKVKHVNTTSNRKYDISSREELAEHIFGDGWQSSFTNS